MPYPQSFIDSVTVSVPSDWYDPDYATDPATIPDSCINALLQEPDFRWAVDHKKGVMYDLIKQLSGYKARDRDKPVTDLQTGEITTEVTKGKTHPPRPQFYLFFAITAYALLHGDIRELNWKPKFNGQLAGQDVMYAMNKYGIYGFADDLKQYPGKEIVGSKYAALYARMYNADPRFKTHGAEPTQLKIDYRKSPIRFCPHCRTIDVIWRGDTFEPGDEIYEEVFNDYIVEVEEQKTSKHASEDQQMYLERGGHLLQPHRFLVDSLPSA